MKKLQQTKILSKINFDKIIILYIILQPIIDIITSLCVRNISEKLTLGVFIRTIFMIYIMIYTIIKVDKKNKWQILIYYFCIAIYCISFMVNSYTKYGFSMIFTQIKGLIKTYYFPIVLASLLIIYKNKNYYTKQKYLNIALAIYVLTIVIGKVFSIGYPTYPFGNNVGTIGLFYAGNEISAIIALLSPICFSTFIFQKFNLWNALLCIFATFAMLEIGTKVAFISIIGLLILSLIISIIKLIRKDDKNFYKQFITILSIGTLIFLFIGNTSAGKNLNIESPFFKAGSSSIDIPGNEKDPDKDNLIDNPSALLSGRNTYFKENLSSYTQSSITGKLLGIGYISSENDIVEENKLVEIDYFDIFLCHGILGTLVYLAPLIIFIIILIKNFFTNFIINIKNNTLIFMLYSVLISFGTALMAGHVFTAPAVSIFLILSMLEILSILNYEKDLENE